MCVRITIQELFDVYSESEGTDLPLQAMYLFVQQPLWDAQPLQPDPESSAGAGAARLWPFVSAAHSLCARVTHSGLHLGSIGSISLTDWSLRSLAEILLALL